MNFFQLFIQTPTTYDDKRVDRLLAKNPDLTAKYEFNKERNLASGGGGFGPVRIIDIYLT